jgi:hypothetical protein
MPILILLLYSLFRKNGRKRKYLLWFLIMFLGCFGGIMKATCYVTLIAVVLVDLVWSAWEEVPMRKRLQKIGLKILLLIAAFGLGAFCKQGIYCSVQYDYNADMEIGWSNYMYNGLNEDTTGACSGEGLEIVRSFAGTDKNTRIQYEMEGIRKRIGDRGIWGTIRFWLRKQVMNFNDGTFSWYQEGYFQAWEYPLNIDSSWKEPLRAFTGRTAAIISGLRRSARDYGFLYCWES